MTTMMTRRGFVATMAAMAAPGSARPGLAHEGHDEATPAATQQMSAGAGTGAAFLTVTNNGAADDRLVSVTGTIAAAIEVHAMKEANGVMEMAPLPDGLAIPAGGQVALAPGGYHVMLIGLTRDLKAGETFELTLTFAQAGEVTLDVPIFISEEAASEAAGTKVTVGDLVIEGVWARQAPALLGNSATPIATPAHGG